MCLDSVQERDSGIVTVTDSDPGFLNIQVDWGIVMAVRPSQLHSKDTAATAFCLLLQ